MQGVGRVALAACVALLAAACADTRPTGYHPMGPRGGFTELKLSPDTYRITVQTNEYTSEVRAQNIAFLRAAHLTLQSGHDRYVIVGGRGVRDRAVGRVKGFNVYEAKGEFVIRMVAKGDPDYADAHDARLIIEQLQPRMAER
jgi:hypothetical protein